MYKIIAEALIFKISFAMTIAINSIKYARP